MIYPNPLNDILNINFTGDFLDKVEITIISIEGQSVHRETLENVGINQKRTIAVDHFATGMYLVKISSDEFTFTKKIIIDKQIKR